MSEETADRRFEFISQLDSDVKKPYELLAERATELGLDSYIPQFEADAENAWFKAVYSHINNISTGLVDDKDLAYEMAIIENDYQTAKVEVGKLAINSSIISSMLTNAKEESDDQQAELLKGYKVEAHAYMMSLTRKEVKKQDLVLPEISDDDIEKHFDTKPITREEIILLANTKQAVSWFWRPLARQYCGPVRLRAEDGMITGPELQFGTKPEEPLPSSIIIDGLVDELDFKSFYSFMRWASGLIDSNLGWKINDVFGPRVGQKAYDLYKELILSRSITPEVK